MIEIVPRENVSRGMQALVPVIAAVVALLLAAIPLWAAGGAGDSVLLADVQGRFRLDVHLYRDADAGDAADLYRVGGGGGISCTTLEYRG